jgi:membrane protein implicated in regulation of membrane protease activity
MTASATARDLAIIVLAMQALVVNILLGVLIWQVWRMVKMLNTEVKPILEDTQETIGTLRGTATFVSDNVVDPVMNTTRSVTKWRGTVSSLTSDLRRANGSSPGGGPSD